MERRNLRNIRKNGFLTKAIDGLILASERMGAGAAIIVDGKRYRILSETSYSNQKEIPQHIKNRIKKVGK